MRSEFKTKFDHLSFSVLVYIKMHEKCEHRASTQQDLNRGRMERRAGGREGGKKEGKRKKRRLVLLLPKSSIFYFY